MVEAFLSFVMMTAASWVLVFVAHSPMLVAFMVCGVALIIVEVLPKPLNHFKMQDLFFGLLGVLFGLHLAGWGP